MSRVTHYTGFRRGPFGQSEGLAVLEESPAVPRDDAAGGAASDAKGFSRLGAQSTTVFVDGSNREAKC